MITSQLSALKAAARGPRNHGSDASVNSMQHTKNVAMGSSTGIGIRSSGSMAGWDGSSSTMLAMNDTGYFASANQTARNRHKGQMALGRSVSAFSPNPVGRGTSINARVSDGRLHRGSGSAARIRALTNFR